MNDKRVDYPMLTYVFGLLPKNATGIDKFISTEFPDPSLDREFYDKVKSHLVHDPCRLASK